MDIPLKINYTPNNNLEISLQVVLGSNVILTEDTWQGRRGHVPVVCMKLWHKSDKEQQINII